MLKLSRRVTVSLAIAIKCRRGANRVWAAGRIVTDLGCILFWREDIRSAIQFQIGSVRAALA